MFKTANLTKLSCFVNTTLQTCLILDTFFIPFIDSLQITLQGVRALTIFQPRLILMRSSDVVGQGHLTFFSTGELMIYKVYFQTVRLNSTFPFDISTGLLTLLTITDSSLLHINAVSKHITFA